jgi:hypothetical protein
MNPSSQPDARPTREELAAKLSDELVRLRDALVSLALSLKDWQFEADQMGKIASQQIVTDTLNKFRLQCPTGTEHWEPPKSSAAKDRQS